MAYKKPESKKEEKVEVAVDESTMTTTPSVSIVDESISSLKEENDSLKKQMEEMQAQLKMMAEMISASRSSAESAPKAEKFIPIVNLSTGVLVLRGTTVHTIEGQFASVTFREREARAIMNNARNVFVKGYAWIADEEFMKEYDLDIACANVLSDEKLKKVLDSSPEYVVEVYKSVPEAQKQIIISMIEEKRSNGQYVDANVIMRLSEVSGHDLMNSIPMED